MRSKIFLNYRRDDTRVWAGRLYEFLAGRIGDDHVFRDVEDLAPGVNFMEAIDRTLDECRVVLVLIGRTWLSITDEDGQRRLDNPKDPVRLEIEAALAGPGTVIPVLLDDAQMPEQDDLPESLKKLTERNAVPVTDLHWRTDSERLLAGLKAPPWWRVRRPMLVGAGAVVVVVVVVGAVLAAGGAPPSTLASGGILGSGDSLRSPNGRYSLQMQPDGNLVVYHDLNAALWTTHTAGNHDAYAFMQPDGNLVIYPTGTSPPAPGQPTPALWYSHTNGNPGASAQLQNDGDLVIESSAGNHVIWQSNANL